jgi:Tol biopolymer transport system component
MRLLPASEERLCQKMRALNRLLIVVFFTFGTGCKDVITGPCGSAAFSLCYQKEANNHWYIFGNSLSGAVAQNISNFPDEQSPKFSPDGRYISFIRDVPVNGPLVYVIDLRDGKYIELTSDGGAAYAEQQSNPGWTKDGRVFFAYHRPLTNRAATYSMNPDGTNKKQILGFGANIYFYGDSYTFLYIGGTKLYKTNIDSTINEFVCELQPDSDHYITIRDFDSNAGNLLVNTNAIPGISDAIATLNVESRQMEVVVTSEEGFPAGLQRYSKDYTKIAFIELGRGAPQSQFLSVFENGVKKRLLELKSPEWFDYHPMEFSPDGRFIAFSKNVYQQGQWVSWKSYLCAVDVFSGRLYAIDEGVSPSWRQ